MLETEPELRALMTAGLAGDAAAHKELLERLSSRLGVRRFRLTRFPYGIIYQVSADTISVLAFAHHRRHPLYWRDRLP